jgi:phosphatidate cytidylyltransferase
VAEQAGSRLMTEPVRKIVVGIVLGAVTIALLLAGTVPLTVYIGVLSLIGSAEFFDLMRRSGARPVPLAGFLAIAGLFALSYGRGERAPLLFPIAIAGAFISSALVAMLRGTIAGSVAAIASTVAGVVYVGVFPSYLVVMLRMASGFRLVLGFALMAVLNDVGSYAAGVWRGRHALASSVSPSKTWEGFVGGAIATLATAALIAGTLSPPFTIGRSLILGGIVVIGAPVGDLCASMVKRDAGAKDSGRLFPGHGGVLDRLDSILIAAPLFFYAWRVLIR